MTSSLANFHEKAHFVKADVAVSVWPSVTGSALRAMLPSALSVSQISCASVHYGIRLDSGYQAGAAIFASVSPPRRGWTKFAWRSHLMLDPKRIRTREAVRLALGALCRDHHLLPFFFGFAGSAPMLPLSCLASSAVGVTQWLVDLSAHPQTV